MLRLFFVILILVLSTLAGGVHYDITNYSIEDGLAQSQVHTLYQDKKGYLWIGTLGGGVSKFDGITFTTFTTTNGLVNNQVLTIYEDSRGDIWFGTEAGVCRFDGKTFFPLQSGNELSHSTVRAILEEPGGTLWFASEKGAWQYDRNSFRHFSSKDGLASDIILAMMRDSRGQLWFGTANNGISKYDGTTFTNFSTNDGLIQDTVYSLLEDRKGNLWFGTAGGISRYDGKTFRNYTMADGLSNNIIKAMIEDREGNLWFGTNSAGICKFNGQAFTCISEDNGLSSNVVWALLEDRERNIWIGTYRGGLDKYSGSMFTYFSTADGLSDNVIRWIWQDSAGNLWFATFRGGAVKYDGKSFTTFTKADGLIDNFILTIYEDRKRNLWLGTYGGVSRYDGKRFVNFTQKDGLTDNVIRSIIEDRYGNIWIGTNQGGICKFDGKTVNTMTHFTTREGLNSNRINTLMEDRQGMIWIGTLEGLCSYNGSTFTNISRVCGIKQKNIYSIIQAKNGALWLAAYGKGIVKYNPSDCSSVLFTCSDPNHQWHNSVVSLCFDDKEQLWIGTEKGIFRLDAAAYEKTGQKIVAHYGKEEGFVGIECIHNSICKDNEGNIWIGTLKGAVKVDPHEEKVNLAEPMTHITDVRFLFGENNPREYARDVSHVDGLPVGLRLPYNKNSLAFDFIGLSFIVPGKVKYQYRLEGFDDEWLTVKEGAYANYSNLPPGSYTFKVKACNNIGIWNKEPASFTFEIRPPLWLTWYFYLLYAGLLAIGIYTLIKVRIRSLENQRKILEEKVLLSTQELKQEKEKIEKINLELELRVKERTTELVRINESLQEEITDRKLAEKALRESEEKFRLVIENANDAVFILQEGKVKFPNPSTINMLGYPAAELSEIPFFTLVHPNDKARALDRCTRCLNGEEFPGTYSFRMMDKGQKELWVELNSVLIQWEEKPATLNFLRDITDRKRLEAQLLEAQKMKAIGTMAGGIAHDFNNLLMGILGNASLILSELPPNHPYFIEVKNIEQLVQSGVHLTRQLLGFARGGKYEITPVDLNQVIKKSIEMFIRTRKEITPHEKYEENLNAVEVDRGQIEQVLLNLYVNAWQAMPGGGHLYLQTENISLVEEDAQIYGLKHGNYVKVSITDTGVGMDESTRQRIFEPFFTTKEMGRGTGLGLASAYGIIKNHGGSIHVYSEKDKGTTFTIYLPTSGKKVAVETELPDLFLKGTETILLVDDEEMVSNVGARLLMKLGYTVLIAASGQEALELYEKNPGKIDLVILDIIMPGLGGEEAFTQLKQMNPAIKVLLSSGYSIDGQAAQIMERGCRGFIQKPFHLRDLSQKIRSILDNE